MAPAARPAGGGLGIGQLGSESLSRKTAIPRTTVQIRVMRECCHSRPSAVTPPSVRTMNSRRPAASVRTTCQCQLQQLIPCNNMWVYFTAPSLVGHCVGRVRAARVAGRHSKHPNRRRIRGSWPLLVRVLLTRIAPARRPSSRCEPWSRCTNPSHQLSIAKRIRVRDTL
jgi:hypothetical protein